MASLEKKVRKEMPSAWGKVYSLLLSNGVHLQITPREVLQKDATDVVLSPSDNHWTGGSVWEAAEVLAELLSEEPGRVRGRRVLELGAGCGLLGIVAGALGAREVTLTDEVLFMMAYNVEANFKGQPDVHQRFKLQQLHWGNEEQIAQAGPPYDLILCSDLLYDRSQHVHLANTIGKLSHVGTDILFATPDGMPSDRSYYCRGFYSSLRQRGFKLSVLALDRPKEKRARVFLDETEFDSGGFDRGTISVLEMYKTSASLSDSD